MLILPGIVPFAWSSVRSALCFTPNAVIPPSAGWVCSNAATWWRKQECPFFNGLCTPSALSDTMKEIGLHCSVPLLLSLAAKTRKSAHSVFFTFKTSRVHPVCRRQLHWQRLSLPHNSINWHILQTNESNRHPYLMLQNTCRFQLVQPNERTDVLCRKQHRFDGALYVGQLRSEKLTTSSTLRIHLQMEKEKLSRCTGLLSLFLLPTHPPTSSLPDSIVY